jgi:hypothetical protein
MKRALCALVLGTAAIATVPAFAAEAITVTPQVTTDNGRVGVGAMYSRDGGKTQNPVGGAWVDTNSGHACAGLSYQVPFCI